MGEEPAKAEVSAPPSSKYHGYPPSPVARVLCEWFGKSRLLPIVIHRRDPKHNAHPTT
jgi:hypothetical protein